MNRLVISLLTTATTAFLATPSFARVTPQPHITNNTNFVAANICTTRGGNVNVRSGPGQQFRVLGSLASGSFISLGRPQRGRDGVRWFPVNSGGLVGWVRGDYVC
jgi:uncharacterized protein YraI